MTGTVATPFSAFFSPSPPRGMMRSTAAVWVASSASSSRPPPATRTIAPSGTPADSAASAAIEARTGVEWAGGGEEREGVEGGGGDRRPPPSPFFFPVFHAQGGGVDRDVRPRLVHDRDDAE